MLPNEHGSWGILSEPLVASIAVAPSLAGAAVVLVFVGAFLVRQPLKVFIADRIGGRDLPRTRFALKYIFIFGALLLLGTVLSLVFGDIKQYLPAALVLPFGAYQIYADVSRKTRELLPEITGTIAISSSAAVIALAGGWPYPNALALWAIMCARLIPSILYVRNRLRLEKGKANSPLAVAVAHIAGFIMVLVFAFYCGLASYLTAAVFAFLLARSVFGLSRFRIKMKAMKIGIWETIYGLLTVLSIIVGYYFQI